MTAKPTYEALEQRIKQLEHEMAKCKHAEDSCRESEARYRLFVQNFQGIAYRGRMDFTPVFFHGAVEAITGYTEKDFLDGRPRWDQLIHPDDLPNIRESLEKIRFVPDYATEREYRIIRKDGQVRWVHELIQNIVDDSGRPVKVQGALYDITKRRKAEEALRESEENYSKLVENSLTGIYVDQDEKIVFANHRLAEIYRYPFEELLDIESWRLVYPEDRDLIRKMRTMRIRGENAPLEYEARGLTKDGELIWITRRNALIEYRGKPAILGNIVDITKQKQGEEELKKINEELKNFVHIVSHDLKTPLISIQGFSSRLLKKYHEKLEEKGRIYLERIMASASRMEALITDLAALATIGRVALPFKLVPSLEIINDVTAELQDRLQKKGIRLVVAPDLPTIHCDRERISQVFQNLIVNAIKYMGATKNPKIEVGYEDMDNLHQFYVRDNGIGIAPQYHRKIFEIFQRVREIESEEGTGLGLTIVDKVVRHHGGKVWVESEKGKGTTFYFTIPKHSPQ
jgi:PAS domain S-box-containing protein